MRHLKSFRIFESESDISFEEWINSALADFSEIEYVPDMDSASSEASAAAYDEVGYNPEEEDPKWAEELDSLASNGEDIINTYGELKDLDPARKEDLKKIKEILPDFIDAISSFSSDAEEISHGWSEFKWDDHSLNLSTDDISSIDSWDFETPGDVSKFRKNIEKILDSVRSCSDECEEIKDTQLEEDREEYERIYNDIFDRYSGISYAEITSKSEFPSPKEAEVIGYVEFYGESSAGRNFLEDPSYSIKISMMTKGMIWDEISDSNPETGIESLNWEYGHESGNGYIILGEELCRDLISIEARITAKGISAGEAKRLISLEGLEIESPKGYGIYRDEITFIDMEDLQKSLGLYKKSDKEKTEYYSFIFGKYGKNMDQEQIQYILKKLPEKSLQSYINDDPAEASIALKNSWSTIKKIYPGLKFPEGYGEDADSMGDLSDLGF